MTSPHGWKQKRTFIRRVHGETRHQSPPCDFLTNGTDPQKGWYPGCWWQGDTPCKGLLPLPHLGCCRLEMSKGPCVDFYTFNSSPRVAGELIGAQSPGLVSVTNDSHIKSACHTVLTTQSCTRSGKKCHTTHWNNPQVWVQELLGASGCLHDQEWGHNSEIVEGYPERRNGGWDQRGSVSRLRVPCSDRNASFAGPCQGRGLRHFQGRPLYWSEPSQDLS